MIWLWLSCVVPESSVDSPALSNTRLLRRMSLDIRGHLPALEEYAMVQQSDIDWEPIVVEMLESPEFEEHLVHRFGDLWHTRVDEFDIVADDFNLDPYEWWFPFARSIGEEPLRWMAHVAATDKSWKEIVTSDTLLANDLLVNIFPVDYVDGTEPEAPNVNNLSTWKESKYQDGRPPVGILSTNGLWWRFPTDSFNMNRTRAAMITKMLLCDDYLARPIDFTASENIIENTETAIREDPSCLTCHASLDPLSSAMFGFWWIERYNPLEATYYHPERELMGMEMMSVSPAWFGTPVTGFAEVGEQIANDIRFHQCTIRQSMEMLYQRPIKAKDFAQTTEILDAFSTAYQYKSIWKSILLSKEYRSVLPTNGAPDTEGDRMLSPYQAEHSLRVLTGYVWKSQGSELMDIDYRTMAGGIDGFQTFERQYYPNLSSTVVLERLSQAHGHFASLNGLVGSGLDAFDFSISFQDPEFSTQLSELRLVLHGREADQQWLGQTLELWIQVYDASGQSTQTAWEIVLGALFQDIDFVRY